MGKRGPTKWALWMGFGMTLLTIWPMQAAESTLWPAPFLSVLNSADTVISVYPVGTRTEPQSAWGPDDVRRQASEDQSLWRKEARPISPKQAQELRLFLLNGGNYFYGPVTMPDAERVCLDLDASGERWTIVCGFSGLKMWKDGKVLRTACLTGDAGKEFQRWIDSFDPPLLPPGH